MDYCKHCGIGLRESMIPIDCCKICETAKGILNDRDFENLAVRITQHLLFKDKGQMQRIYHALKTLGKD